MVAALYKADEIATLADIDEVIAKLKVTGEQIIAFENDDRISDEDMEFLMGVWEFYYSTALVQFTNAVILKSPITSTDKSMGVSAKYLASAGFSIQYPIYSIEDATEL